VSRDNEAKYEAAIRADERRRVLKELSDWTVGRYIDRMSLAIKLDEMREELNRGDG
jgi:hypothetical protein